MYNITSPKFMKVTTFTELFLKVVKVITNGWSKDAFWWCCLQIGKGARDVTFKNHYPSQCKLSGDATA